jgi:hypothetical protein
MRLKTMGIRNWSQTRRNGGEFYLKPGPHWTVLLEDNDERKEAISDFTATHTAILKLFQVEDGQTSDETHTVIVMVLRRDMNVPTVVGLQYASKTTQNFSHHNWS